MDSKEEAPSTSTSHSTTSTSATTSDQSTSAVTIIKKRGRPKGSLNKPKPQTAPPQVVTTTKQPEPTVQEATQFSKEDSLASTTSLQGPQSVEPSGSASAATSTEKSQMPESAVKMLISAFVPRMTEYKTAVKKGQKTKIWDDISKDIEEQTGFLGTGENYRKKYDKLYSRYKEVKDHNSKTGRDALTFKYEEDFDNALEAVDNVDINVPTAESGGGLQTAITARRRPKGHITPRTQLTEFERQQLTLMERDINNREAFMNKLLEKEDKKLEILNKLLPKH